MHDTGATEALSSNLERGRCGKKGEKKSEITQEIGDSEKEGGTLRRSFLGRSLQYATISWLAMEIQLGRLESSKGKKVVGT